MKTTLRCGVFLTLLACAAATFAQAPANVARPSGGAVAVIDISKIFKEHPRFRAMLDQMKVDVENAEGGMRKDRDEIKNMVEQLKTFAVGSPNYKQMEERVATANAQLQLKMSLQKNDFMNREASIYYDVYQEIEKEVAYFAQRHGIALVLRYNDVDMNAQDRQTVLAGVNKAVVYQNNIDITYDILERLKQMNRPGPVAGPQGTDPRLGGGGSTIPGVNTGIRRN